MNNSNTNLDTSKLLQAMQGALCSSNAKINQMNQVFDVTQNVVLGIQCAPVVYQYSLVHLQVMGQDGYFAMNHNIAVFKYPQLKFGFRF